MKKFNKTTYFCVQFIYSDYSDYSETFSTEWKQKEMIEYMKDCEYHKQKIERDNLEVTDIYISKVKKFSKDMWD